MAIIALKAWYLAQYEPIREVVKRPPDLRLSRNSLLKTGLRADFLDDNQAVQESVWFENYLEGYTVEFYIEGSGGYAISNIDLISHEIYFTKQEITAILDPIIFFSSQKEYPAASDAIRDTIETALEKLNERSRLILSLVEAQRPQEGPLRLSDTQLRKLRKSLLFVADTTPITSIPSDKQSHLIPHPNVCIELGYALQTKRTGQILLVQMERPDLSGNLPFDFPLQQNLLFKNASELSKTLPSLLESLLQRFNLFN